MHAYVVFGWKKEVPDRNIGVPPVRIKVLD
jgi:hypothetical protein